MANNSIIGLGQTAVDSATFVIADNAAMTFGMYGADGTALHPYSRIHIMHDAPVGAVKLHTLTPDPKTNPMTVQGPATVFLRRPAQTELGVDVGGFSDDGLGSP